MSLTDCAESFAFAAEPLAEQPPKAVAAIPATNAAPAALMNCLRELVRFKSLPIVTLLSVFSSNEASHQREDEASLGGVEASSEFEASRGTKLQWPHCSVRIMACATPEGRDFAVFEDDPKWVTFYFRRS